MEENTPKAGGKGARVKTFIRKILGKSPFTSAVTIFFIVIVCLLLGFSKETIQRYEDAIIRKGQELLGIEEKNQCGEGWTFYQQDVIGLSFCYPQEWGNVTLPKEPVTRLEGLLDGAYDRNSFLIGFDKNDNASLQLFNEEYNGEKYSDGATEQYYNADNIKKLRMDGNICGYKMDFDLAWEYGGNVSEPYSACDGGIKAAIVDTQEYFDKETHSALLQSSAYTKIQNGYFDHVLVTYIYGSTGQLEQKFDNVDAFLTQAGKAQEDFAKEKADFATFVSSIKTFVPEKKVQAEFETVAGEDARVTAIRKYYWLLEGGKLQEAYAMKASEDAETYEEFSSQYKNVYVAKPSDIQNVGGDDFSFLVQYQDQNESEVKYSVKMTVMDGKLKITVIEEFKGTTADFGQYSASAVERNGKLYLILKKGETETIVKEGKDYPAEAKAAGFGESFSDIKFSSQGNYLIYSTDDYEASSRTLYDVKNGKEITQVKGAFADSFDVTPDEKYFYFCTSVGEGVYDIIPGKVYSLPDFQVAFDASGGEHDGYADHTCVYDQERKAIVFSSSGPNDTSKPQQAGNTFFFLE